MTSKRTSRFTSPAVVGQHVTGISEGPDYRTEWDGIYDGERASEWTGEPTHYFRDGHIGSTAQGLHGIPASQFAPTVEA